MKRLKILALVHDHLIPPERATPEEVEAAPWRTEYDVLRCLEELGHEVHLVGVASDLEPIGRAVRDAASARQPAPRSDGSRPP